MLKSVRTYFNTILQTNLTILHGQRTYTLIQLFGIKLNNNYHYISS